MLLLQDPVPVLIPAGDRVGGFLITVNHGLDLSLAADPAGGGIAAVDGESRIRVGGTDARHHEPSQCGESPCLRAGKLPARAGELQEPLQVDLHMRDSALHDVLPVRAPIPVFTQ